MGLENLVGRKSQLYVVSSAIHLVSLKSSGRGRAKEAKDVHRSSCMYRGKGTKQKRLNIYTERIVRNISSDGVCEIAVYSRKFIWLHCSTLVCQLV